VCVVTIMYNNYKNNKKTAKNTFLHTSTIVVVDDKTQRIVTSENFWLVVSSEYAQTTMEEPELRNESGIFL
jgi:hypothetical protein